MYFSGIEPRLPNRPPVSPIILPTSQENLSWIPGQSTQYVDLTTHTKERISSHVIFLSSESFPQGTGPNLISCFPFYPILCGSFSQPWLYRNLSANFYLAVSDTCSMCRCDVFLICLLRKVSSTSSYSAIMISSPGFIYINVCI